MNRVEVGFFSLSQSLGRDEDRAYIAWHQLDHMPEQYQLEGLFHGQRWMSTPACRAARRAAVGGWASVEHVVLYLMGQPVMRTLDDFMRLGAGLREAGRYPVALPSVFAGAARFVGASAAPAALVSPEVVPWRPNRGIFLTVEEAGGSTVDDSAVMDIPGVAGVWCFETGEPYRRWQRSRDDLRFTVVYVDGDPVRVAAEVGDAFSEGRSDESSGLLLAAPFEAIAPWDWQPLSTAIKPAGG